jgi:transposase
MPDGAAPDPRLERRIVMIISQGRTVTETSLAKRLGLPLGTIAAALARIERRRESAEDRAYRAARAAADRRFAVSMAGRRFDDVGTR